MQERLLQILAIMGAASLILSIASFAFFYNSFNELSRRTDLLGETQDSLIDLFAPEGFALLKAAKDEGRLNVMGTLTYDWADQYIAAFHAKYPWIEVEYTRLLTQEQLPRLQADRAANSFTFDYDLGISFPSAQYVQMVKDGYYAPYVPPSLSEWPQNESYIDTELGGFNVLVFTYCIIYNTDLVPADKIPTTWWNLTDPYFKGRLGMTDPRIAGGAWNQYYYLVQKYGEEWFRGIGLNNPLLTGSVVTIAQKVASGELMVGMGLDAYTWPLMDEGAPMVVTYPKDGPYTLGIRANVLANATHPNCAKLFHAFLASAEGQRVNLDRLRIFSGYYHDKSPRPTEGIPTLDAIKSVYVPLDADKYFAELIVQIKEWLGL